MRSAFDETTTDEEDDNWRVWLWEVGLKHGQGQMIVTQKLKFISRPAGCLNFECDLVRSHPKTNERKMAKKAAKKKAKKSGSDNANGKEICLPEDKIKFLEAQLKSLELQLSHRVESCASTTLEYESMKRSFDEISQKYEAEKEMTVGLTRDMTRQYKGMQDDLLKKLNDREQRIQELTDTLSATKALHQSEMEEKDKIIEDRDTNLKKLNDKLNEICADFAEMLKGLLHQLMERIEVQGASYNGNAPIQKLMQSACYNYKSTT